MSLYFKYNRMKEFNKILIGFKAVKTALWKWIMKNVDKLYKKYYNAYKSDYDTDDELNKTKRKVWPQ